MGVNVKILAQTAMDRFYRQYKTDSDFFDIPDFISAIGFALSTFYLSVYKERYAEIAAQKTDEVVSFDPLTLNTQRVALEKEGDVFVGKFSKPVMSFAYSNSSPGIQKVSVALPKNNYGKSVELLNEQWQIKLIPKSNFLFYTPIPNGISISSSCLFDVEEVNVLYVPSISGDDYEVPDVLTDMVLDKTVASFHQLPGVVKKTNDQNQNMTIETEINKNSIR